MKRSLIAHSNFEIPEDVVSSHDILKKGKIFKQFL